MQRLGSILNDMEILICQPYRVTFFKNKIKQKSARQYRKRSSLHLTLVCFLGFTPIETPCICVSYASTKHLKHASNSHNKTQFTSTAAFAL